MRRRHRFGAGLIPLVLGVAIARHLISGPASPVIGTVSVGEWAYQVAEVPQAGRVFVAIAHGSLKVLDAGSGRVVGTILLPGQPSDLVLDAPTNRVFAVDPGTLLLSHLIVVDAAREAVVLTQPFSILEPIVDEQTGRVYAAARDTQDPEYHRLLILDGRSGTLLHQTLLKGPGPLTLGVDARTKRVFAASRDDDTVTMLDAGNDRLLRTVKVGHLPAAVAVDARTARVFVTNNGAGTVSVLDASGGALLHTIEVGPYPAGAVVDERTDRVFVVHGRGNMDPPYQLSDTDQGGVTMLDGRTGAVLGSAPVGGSPFDDVAFRATATNIAVDARRGRVFVIDQPPRDRYGVRTSGYGSVSVLDARSGQVLRTIPVGWNPISLAVDETRARLFVLNTSSGCLPGTTPVGWLPKPLRRWLPFMPAPTQPTCAASATVTVIDTART